MTSRSTSRWIAVGIWVIAIAISARLWLTRAEPPESRRPTVSVLIAALEPVPEAQPAPPAPPPRALRPNIVLISIDTLRRDHLGCYGYPRDTSPAIDRLASDGTVFDQAVVPIPKTTPSLVSLMSGLQPMTHRIVELGVPIDPAVPMIAEILQESGYVTAGVCGQYNCNRIFGFDRGFHHFDDEFDDEFDAEPDAEVDGEVAEQVGIETHPDRRGGGFHPGSEKRAGEIVDEAVAWIGAERGQPFFLWLHFMDPHAGYAPPEPYLSRYSGDPPRAADSFTGAHVPAGLISQQARIEGLTEYATYVNRYDGEIRYLDDQLARLFSTLRQRGLYDDALIVFTSDHGEYMGEASDELRFFKHGVGLFESEIRAPLLFKLPGNSGRGSRSDRLVSTIDVAPTLTAFAGVGDGPPVEGVTLLGPVSGSADSDFRRHQLLRLPGRELVFGVRTARQKVILRLPGSLDSVRESLQNGQGTEASVEAYDLESDPLERHDRAAENPELIDWAARELARWLVRTPVLQLAPGDSHELSPEVRQHLEELGYLR